VPAAPPPPPAEPKPPEPKPPEPPPPKVHTLTIYNGRSVTKAVFTLGEKDQDTNTQIEKSQPDAEAALKKPAPRPAAPQKP
jgi:hypothetical protein